MAIKPILFNTEMVKAILKGRKTQTRRVIKQKDGTRFTASSHLIARRFISASNAVAKAPCAPGDILWVRETWHKDAGRYMYKANYVEDEKFYRNGKEVTLCWRPSIHMPREAARIFLRVKDVRIERLQDMDEEAAIADGFADSPAGTASPLERFAVLWDKTVKRDDLRAYGYHANPWVWVIEFERCEAPKNERKG